MSWFRTTDGHPPPQLLACRIAGRFVQPRLEAVTVEQFPGDGRPAGEHRHPVLHLVLYTDGQGACRLDGHQSDCRPGDCVLVDPDQPHAFGDLSRRPCRYRAITLSLLDDRGTPTTHGWQSWLTALSGAVCQGPTGPKRLAPALREQLVTCQQNLLDILTADQGCDWFAAHHALLEILTLIARGPLAQPIAQQANDGLQAAHTAIEQGYQRPLPVADLARIAGLSPGRFHDRFKARYGTSPTALQLSLRIRAAQTLLRASSLPCKAIAERVGFADSAAFSKAFSKHCGCSPSQWRDGLPEASL